VQESPLNQIPIVAPIVHIFLTIIGISRAAALKRVKIMDLHAYLLTISSENVLFAWMATSL
jgi:hypothetical protein